MERRTRDSLLTRAKASGNTISGYAIVFYRAGDPGTEYELWPASGTTRGAVERIMPGALDRSLAEVDCRCFWSHDSSQVLGRESSGTLKLELDSVGLKYTVVVGSAPAAQNALEAVRRGDVDGSSFGFQIYKGGERWIMPDSGPEVRELTEIAVYEVSPVALPAYTGTSAVVRSEADRNEFDRLADRARQARMEHDLRRRGIYVDNHSARYVDPHRQKLLDDMKRLGI